MFPFDTAGVDSLADLFIRQDNASLRNWQEARPEFELTERGLILGWAITLWLNEDPILPQRKAKAPEVSDPETICINLLHAAWSGLVNATRLALYGAHVDALNLIRSAFEATFHAEYFRDHPSNAIEWGKAGQITDLDARRVFISRFERKKQIRQSVEKKYLPDRSLSRGYHELSTFGTHINPITTFLRLSSNIQGIANLGFMSVGKSEATRLCAIRILHILRYEIGRAHV